MFEQSDKVGDGFLFSNSLAQLLGAPELAQQISMFSMWLRQAVDCVQGAVQCAVFAL